MTRYANNAELVKAYVHGWEDGHVGNMYFEGVHAGKEISGEILSWLTRGIGKNITEITGRLEELFDEGGNLTGTKQIQQTVTKTKN